MQTVMPDGKTKIPSAIDEEVMSLLYSIPTDAGGPNIEEVDADVLRLVGTAIVRWVASFELSDAAPSPIEATCREYHESWVSGIFTTSLAGHTVMSGTQHGENGPLAKKRHLALQALPIVQPAAARYILENRHPPEGESELCLAFHLAVRRNAIEALAGGSLAARLSEVYKPQGGGTQGDRKVGILHALEIMRGTVLGRKIFAEVLKGAQLSEIK